MLPIFTRSLIWTYRIVYQNPPESDEPSYWTLWAGALARYVRDLQLPNSPVTLLFGGILSEVRLSLYWALQWTHSPLSREVWRCLYEADREGIIEFIEGQSEGPAREAACAATVEVASEADRERLCAVGVLE
jgi:hypothetical protein